MEIKMETEYRDGLEYFKIPLRGQGRASRKAACSSPFPLGPPAAPARASRVEHAGNGLGPRPSPKEGGEQPLRVALGVGTAVLALTASRMAQGQGSTALRGFPLTSTGPSVTLLTRLL